MRVATFNVQNMRLRQTPHGPHLDGAIDRDVAHDADWRLDLMDRRLTAEVLARIDADIVCLQEVFDQATLDHFHDAFLCRAGAAPYPYRYCLPGNDGHGLDVALLARDKPKHVQSHAGARARDLGLQDPDDLLKGGPVFRRDCLEVVFSDLALFVCHLKAPYPDVERATAIRALEIQAIRRVIEQALPAPVAAFWMILGDLNTAAGIGPAADRDLAPLLEGFSVDLMERIPDGAGWTYRLPDTGEVCSPDAMLSSPALARLAASSVPQIERGGMGRYSTSKAGCESVPGGQTRPKASDHAAIWIDLPDLSWSDPAAPHET